ncbi:MAG TPA: hypothetical protein VK184_24570 [Nostocaceae cyanobacterium]|nr:hypothetical protein [Nostocaceae cyanobacterium]
MAKKSKGFQELLQDKNSLKRSIKVFQKLIERVKNTASDVDPEIVFEQENTAKMSEILHIYVEPYLLPSDNYGVRKTVLDIGILGWNAAICPEHLKQKLINDFYQDFFAEYPDELKQEIKTWIDVLIERKKKYFANINRMILSCKIEETEDSYDLLVFSTMLPDEDLTSQET